MGRRTGSALPTFVGMLVSRSARYLGVQVGTQSSADQWLVVEAKLLARATDVAASAATLVTKVQL